MEFIELSRWSLRQTSNVKCDTMMIVISINFHFFRETPAIASRTPRGPWTPVLESLLYISYQHAWYSNNNIMIAKRLFSCNERKDEIT